MEIYKIPRRENETNSDYVYRSLRESIIKVTLRPGDIISEPLLQNHFGMSRSPIREALSILKHENLVTVAPRSRTQVVLINEELIMESRYMRCIMEEKILQLVLQKDTSPLTRRLTEILDEAEETMKHGGASAVKTIFDYDSLYHGAEFEFVGFHYLWDYIRTLNIQYSRFLNLYVEEKLYGESFLPDHRKLIEWIRNKDTDRLETYIQNNYTHVAGYLKELKLKHPAYFGKRQNEGQTFHI